MNRTADVTGGPGSSLPDNGRTVDRFNRGAIAGLETCLINAQEERMLRDIGLRVLGNLVPLTDRSDWTAGYLHGLALGAQQIGRNVRLRAELRNA